MLKETMHYLAPDRSSVEADRRRPNPRRPAMDRDSAPLDSDRCRPAVKLRVTVPDMHTALCQGFSDVTPAHAASDA